MGANYSMEEPDTNDQVSEENYYNNIRKINYENDNILRFHEISGTNVTFDSTHTKAKRTDGFCNAIVLSSRPLRTNEIVYIKFNKVSECWRGFMRFGVTCKDPDFNQNDIKNARYVCPDLTNKKGYWARAMNDEIKDDDIFYFYINDQGNMYYGINNVSKGLFFEDLKIKPDTKLWTICDIYGNVMSIEFIDAAQAGFIPTIVNSNNEMPNISQLSLASSSPTSSLTSNDSIGSNNTRSMVQIEALFNNFQGLHDNDLNQSLATNSILYPTMIKKNCCNEELDLSLPVFKLLHHSDHEETEMAEFNRFKFNSNIYGRNVKFNRLFTIAYRTNMSSTNAYVFIDKEMLVDHSLCIQIVDIDSTETDTNNNNISETSLAFGCTNFLIDKINKIDLPNDSYDLLNRSEYWIVNKNILNNPSVGDELCLSVDKSGNIEYKVNGQVRTKCLFNVDTTQKLHFFFNICGKTTAIRIIPSCKPASCISKTKNFHVSSKTTTIHDLNKMAIGQNKIAAKNLIREECLVCLGAQIECVIYSCGHMCMCYNCAIKILNSRTPTSKPLCPLCRFEIKDVIRVYKS